MAYQVPSLQITQEFTQVPVFTTSPLSALIIGSYLPIGYISLSSTGIINTTSAGSGYTQVPSVVFTNHVSDTTGDGAAAYAVLNGSGGVSQIILTNRGTGYTHAPTVSFVRGLGDVTGAGAAISTTITVTTGRASSPVKIYSENIGSVNTESDILNLFGDISIANPIAYGLYCALQNSGSTSVYYATVATDDETGYAAALALAEKKNNYYGIVPLTFNSTIQADVIAHVNAMSTPEKAKWRTCWLATDYTRTGSTDSQIASFLSNIVSGGSRRVHQVFPTRYKVDAATIVPGYYLAASLAALRAGAAPHQPLTNTEVVGPYHLTDVVNIFSEDQLDTLAAAGVWIVTQDQLGGMAYTRHQLTNGDSTILNYREDSVTANVDSISYGLQSALAPYVGVYNISPTAIQSVQAALDAELRYRLTNTYTARAGNQLLSYKIVSIAQDSTFLDKLNIVIQIQVPYPMNYITVTLSV
jgi:hypothetical protein